MQAMHSELNVVDISRRSEIGDEPHGQQANNKNALGSEVVLVEKELYDVCDVTEALVEEPALADASDNQQVEPEASQHDNSEHEIEQVESGEIDRSGEFVAAWVRINFPDVANEAELRYQASTTNTVNNMAAGENSPDHGDTPFDAGYKLCICEECNASSATFCCEECGLALCFRCTDAIHIVRNA
ncbi:unnamed protein product [Phytophthora fragariaefolia]|uniref:Unnamed protein product n=1 Tax=Phytophthora fragariaefolia TaxID=1490495 RepID=A0A9W6X3W4_9STRA|nr:unnamed protein product [Phytophthora fragariaefolia]